ncbi:MAG: hypothetical protein AAGC55_03040, partial [Myxococcota bacterium]
FGADTADRRELLIQAWYPAVPAPDAEPMPRFAGDRYLELLTDYMELPPFILDHANLVASHSYHRAPGVAGQRFPVILFNHGYIGHVAQNTIQMEELASHGYIVLSIAHPYESMLVTYPDGREVPFAELHVDAALTEAPLELWEAYSAAEGEPARDRALADYLAASTLLNQTVALWTADNRFVLDQLAALDRDHALLAGRLDLERIAVMGMSFGGGVAGQVCLQDRRCKAVLNLDGLQNGDLLTGQLDQPYMMLLNEEAGAFVNSFMLRRSRDTVYRLTVADTTHLDFSDFTTLSSTFRHIGMLGAISTERVVAITNTYMVGFLDKHLKGREVPLLDGPSSDFTEVRFEVSRVRAAIRR